MNIFNSRIDKYYATQKSMVFLTLILVNKPVKFELKAKHTYFFIVIFLWKKDKYVSHTIFIFHNKNILIKYTVKSSEKKYERPTNKFKRIHNFFWNFFISKKTYLATYQNKMS